MTDPSVQFDNWCVNLVSMTRLEPGMVRLLRDTAPGVWVAVRALYATANQPGPPDDTLAAAWLPELGDRAEFAVIVFCEPEYGWTTHAFYNVHRLLRNHPASGIT